jgi:Flp pilus assembly protein TadD
MKRTAYFFALLLALGLTAKPALADTIPEARSKSKSASFEAGQKAVEAKDFKAALASLAKAAQETPNDADVQNLLGYSYRKLGDFDKAMEHYRLALKIEPNHRGAHEYMGELHLEQDRLADAEKELQALSKACPWFGKCEEYEDLKAAIAKYKGKK